MMTPEDYLLAWSLYLGACAVLLIATWRLTRPFWGWLRDLLRVVVAVLLLTPASVDLEGGHLAPSMFVVAFELLTAPEGGTGPVLAVRLLLFAIFGVIGAWALRLLGWWLLGRRHARPG